MKQINQQGLAMERQRERDKKREEVLNHRFSKIKERLENLESKVFGHVVDLQNATVEEDEDIVDEILTESKDEVELKSDVDGNDVIEDDKEKDTIEQAVKENEKATE